jgi:hypothetical protein
VSAHEELRELVQRYARAADARDIPALEALFDPDAELDGVRGVMRLPQWLETMRTPRPDGYSMHMLGDPLIVLDEAAGKATLDTYGVVYAPDRTLGMRYIDDAVRAQGRWVIRHRVSRIVWSR